VLEFIRSTSIPVAPVRTFACASRDLLLPGTVNFGEANRGMTIVMQAG
jgi:hypothetical protein